MKMYQIRENAHDQAHRMSVHILRQARHMQRNGDPIGASALLGVLVRYVFVRRYCVERGTTDESLQGGIV